MDSFYINTLLFIILLTGSCSLVSERAKVAPQWGQVTISIHSTVDYPNPYMDVDVHAVFTHEDGTVIRRPAFWDGNNIWRIRFSSPLASGEWAWITYCSDIDNEGLHNIEGSIRSVRQPGDNKLTERGLLRMSPGRRTIVHADGRPFVLTADTPWALPFRGTAETVSVYAKDRKAKGFNAALLMTLMPDREADGPNDRRSPGGFARAFEDLPQGHLTRMNPEYFQCLDTLISILLDHEIVPVYQPVFHGFGWKGLNILGWNIDPGEYARYCRYLVARYGAGPALWLAGGDSHGNNPGIKEAGMEIEEWDAYRQPVGIHYNPFDDYCPDYMSHESCFHENRVHQDASWLDFQWCQTGHDGYHLPHKVFRMYYNKPEKGVANGEPTYEAIGMNPGRAAGWWQGHEAWLQFTSGGTMGHVYGAAGLWQWKLYPDEPGWPAWADGKGLSWREAIDLEGSAYVGYFGKILQNYDITDIFVRHDLANGEHLLARTGDLYICYLPEGGEVRIIGVPPDMSYRWYDPVNGRATNDQWVTRDIFTAPGGGPSVLIIGDKLP